MIPKWSSWRFDAIGLLLFAGLAWEACREPGLANGGALGFVVGFWSALHVGARLAAAMRRLGYQEGRRAELDALAQKLAP